MDWFYSDWLSWTSCKCAFRSKTRMHSKRMRTARLCIVAGGVMTFDPGRGQVGVVTFDPGWGEVLWPLTLGRGVGVMSFDPGQREVVWWPLTLDTGELLWPLTLGEGGVITFDPGRGEVLWPLTLGRGGGWSLVLSTSSSPVELDRQMPVKTSPSLASLRGR